MSTYLKQFSVIQLHFLCALVGSSSSGNKKHFINRLTNNLSLDEILKIVNEYRNFEYYAVCFGDSVHSFFTNNEKKSGDFCNTCKKNCVMDICDNPIYGISIDIIQTGKPGKQIPIAVRNIVWNTYIGTDKREGKCLCCSQENISSANFHCGHVISRKNGGLETIGNLRPICGHCNSSMHSTNMDEFMGRHGIKKPKNWNGIDASVDSSEDDESADSLNIDEFMGLYNITKLPDWKMESLVDTSEDDVSADSSDDDSTDSSEDEENHNLEDKHIAMILPTYVTSDLGVQEKLFKIEGKKKFQYCKGTLYIFNEITGMYDDHIETLYQYLIKNKQYLNIQLNKTEMGNYGELATLMKRVTQFVKNVSRNDDWLDNTENTSLGYLLFKNGIYNMVLGTFDPKFNPDIVFHARIPWNFSERNSKEVTNAMKISFKRLFEDPKPMIAALARALAGDIKIKKFYICLGRSDSGKSYLVKMLRSAFGSYVGIFNVETLAKDPKDIIKMDWTIPMRFSRIVLSNGLNDKKILDGDAIKQHSSGGDRLTIETRNAEKMSFTPHYTIFCMTNAIPEIEPLDKSVEGRLEYIEFPFVFVDEEDKGKKKYYREKDMELDNVMAKESFVNGFIHIILDAYKDFLKNGMPKFDQEVKNKWTTGARQKNEIIELIEEHYDIADNEEDKKTYTVNVSVLTEFRKNNKQVFQTITAQQFNKILKDKLDLREGRSGGTRFWYGMRKKGIVMDELG